VVDLAFAFFVRFSVHEPSGTATGAFAKFARKFYAHVTGVDPEQHRGLDRQIRQAVTPRSARFADRPVYDPAGHAWLAAFLNHWLGRTRP
jgi:hypothetical protein